MSTSVGGKVWRVREENIEVARTIDSRLKCGSLTSRILSARGFSTSDEAFSFLNQTLRNLHDPFDFMDMEKAVGLISETLESHQKILIYGDYDADGITSTALLSKALTPGFGEERIEHKLPSRYGDGYGITGEVIRNASENGTGLIITVDCGIRATEAAETAMDEGVKMIITDHHEPGSSLPGSDALLDPKVPGEGYPFRELAGVGVAFKLAHALQMREIIPVDVRNLLDLVAFGTVADLVPLKDENRTLVTIGLKRMAETDSPGIRALMAESGVDVFNGPRASDIAFRMGPRINSAGRMGDPDMALELFLTEDRVDAELFADQLNKLNFKRKAVGKRLVEEVADIIEGTGIGEDPFMIVAGEGWNPGVIGITASRIMNGLSRPVGILTIDEEGITKGSLRAPDGFDLGPALDEASDLLEEYGGHERAAGLTLHRENIGPLRKRLCDFMEKEYSGSEIIPTLQVDLDLFPDELVKNEVQMLEKLEPFGISNPVPMISLRDVEIENGVTTVGDGKHLKFRLNTSVGPVSCIYFNSGELAGKLGPGSVVSIAGEPSIHKWGGRVDVQINIADMMIEDN